MAKSWRMAKALDTLLSQINALSPNRDKSSDGGIGNAEHASRNSDHNPYIIDPATGVGVVRARDFTHDPAHGIDSELLAQAIINSHDERIRYIISNRKICSGTDDKHPAWAWRPYPVPPNKNPHNHHCHVSVKEDKAHYDNAKIWVFSLGVTPAHVTAPTVKTYPVLRKGDNGVDVMRLQDLLNQHGALLKADGNFGNATESAVEVFQKKVGLVGDGIVGGYTWRILKS